MVKLPDVLLIIRSINIYADIIKLQWKYVYATDPG